MSLVGAVLANKADSRSFYLVTLQNVTLSMNICRDRPINEGGLSKLN